MRTPLTCCQLPATLRRSMESARDGQAKQSGISADHETADAI